MKQSTKTFFILYLAAMAAVIMVLPYVFTMQSEVLSEMEIPIHIIVATAIIQSAILFAIAIWVGLKTSKQVGLTLPLLSAWQNQQKIDYRQTLIISIISGLLVGIAIIAINSLWFSSVVITTTAPIWQGALGSFYGGIGEEILMRLFLMSLFMFILIKIFRRTKPNAAITWFSIILVAIIFGLGHLPVTAAITEAITPTVVLRAIVLNGIGGVVFGWLYWKKGLESAMISHFFADIMLLIILPLIYLL